MNITIRKKFDLILNFFLFFKKKKEIEKEIKVAKLKEKINDQMWTLNLVIINNNIVIFSFLFLEQKRFSIFGALLRKEK